MTADNLERAIQHLHNLLGELEYVHETGDVQDSRRNAPQHMQAARAFILEIHPDALALDEESEANADASYAVDMEA